jgi:hypothetical protein
MGAEDLNRYNEDEIRRLQQFAATIRAIDSAATGATLGAFRSSAVGNLDPGLPFSGEQQHGRGRPFET